MDISSPYSFLYFISAGCLAFFALLIFFRIEAVRISREFAIFQFILALFYGTLGLSLFLESVNIQIIVYRFSTMIALAALLTFCFFIRDVLEMRKPTGLIFSWTVTAVFGCIAGIIIFDWFEPIEIVRTSNDILTHLFRGILLVGSFFLLVFSFYRHEASLARERIRIFFVAAGVVVVGEVAAFWMRSDDLISDTIFICSALLGSALGTYALTHRRLIEFGEIFQRTIVWILTSVVLFLLFYFSFAIFRPWLLQENVFGFIGSFLALFLIIFLFFRFVHVRLDQALRQKTYLQAQILDRFRRELITLHSPTELFDRVEGVLYETLEIEHIEVYRVHREEPNPKLILLSHSGSRAPHAIAVSDVDSLDTFFARRYFISADDEILRQTTLSSVELQNILSKCDGQGVIALKIEEKVSVLLVLGKRRNRKFYTHNAFQVLDRLVPHIQISFSNAQFYEDSTRWSKELEKRVADRTNELNRLNQEFQEERDEALRLSSVTQGRESRLAELKKYYDGLKTKP